jgi:tRNA pseudouridine55 synthase
MDDLNGIVVVNKEKGFTSHDVVNVIRKTLGTRKVGHTGTLDPNAEGVLPICVGRSTKACDMLTFSDKEYVATVKLGISTDTYDIWGTVTKTSEVSVKSEELINAISAFTGEIEQMPPMYSAIKQNGKKLYELAREGIEVERKKRKITIYECELLSFKEDTFTIRVLCSKGTYIRSLCHDIGESLGCGAAMTSLVRTKSSVFDIENSLTLDEIKEKVALDGAKSVLACVDMVFMHYPSIKVTDAVKSRLKSGAFSLVKAKIGTYRAYDYNGEFVGVTEVFEGEKGNVIKIIKAF